MRYLGNARPAPAGHINSPSDLRVIYTARADAVTVDAPAVDLPRQRRQTVTTTDSEQSEPQVTMTKAWENI